MLNHDAAPFNSELDLIDEVGAKVNAILLSSRMIIFIREPTWIADLVDVGLL